MANPIPYQNLFDIDGLKQATVELQAATDAYSNAATEDFKRIENVSKSLRLELEKINQTMQGGSIRLMDDAGQQQVTAYSRQISELTSQYRNLQDQVAGMQRQMQTNNQALAEARIKESELRQELTQGRIATQAARTELAEYTLQTRQAAQANREAATTQTAATGSYREAQLALTELGKEIRNADGGLKSMTPELQAKVTQYNKLNDELKAFDARMGNFQRNVGNYKSGFAGLSNSINQITRELPAFTNSLQTGFLGISNNLPILFDEISKVNKVLKETAEAGAVAAGEQATAQALLGGATEEAAAEVGNLAKEQALAAAEGKKGVGIFKAMAGSLFTVGTALSIGVTLLTIYGPKLFEFIGALFKGKEAVDAVKLSFGELNKALASTEFSKAITDVNRLTIEFGLARKGVMDKEEVLKDYNDTLGKTFGTTEDLNEAEAVTIANASKYIEATLAKSAATLALQDAAKLTYETRQKNLELEEKILDVQRNGTGFAKAFEITSFQRDIANNNAELEEQLKGYNKIATDFLTQSGTITTTYKKTGNIIADSQLTSIEQIKNRIAELSKLPSSAIDGSEVNNRIDALKKRLKELQGSTKEAAEGFALLEEQLNKLALALQKAIIDDYAKHQGKESENTKKLADQYVNLTDKIKKLKDAYAESEDESRRREAFNNRGKNPILKAVGGGAVDAGGLSNALTTSALTTELENTQRALEAIQDKYAKANQEIFKSYRDRKITLNQYNEEIQLSQDKAADEVFEKEKHLADLRIQLAISGYGKNSKEYRSALKALGDLQDKYNKDSLTRDERLLAAKLKLQQEAIAILQKSAQTISRITGNSGLGALFGDISTDLINGIGKGETFQKTAELGMDAINTYTEFMIQASERRIAQLNKEKDHDLALAGNNAEAKTKIEEEYNNKVTEEKRKQATLSKISALAEIAINTAVAVTKTAAVTGPLAFLLAPALIALGAVQAAIVLATPIPQYEKGRADGAAEFAEVNERGPELIGQRGKWRLANRGMRGVTFLNKGDQVKTATDTKQMLANGMITQDGQYVTNVSQSKSIYDQYIMAAGRSIGIDYGMMAGAVADGVSGLPVTEHNYNERGYQKNLRIKNTRIMDINRRNRF